MTTTDTLTIRTAGPADADALRRLAELDSARPLTGDVLLAESAGRPIAAVSVDGGRAIADPFQPTAETVAILRVRAVQLRAADAPRRTIGRAVRLRVASG